MDDRALQIGQISKRSGVSVDTIRFYEKKGLIHSYSRTRGGFRLFRPNTIEQIRFVKLAQELGFSLTEINGLLGSGGVEECRQVRSLLRQKISEVDKQISKMRAFRITLSRHLAACDRELEQNGQSAECPAFFELNE